ncbi:hypothetical protein Daus18300_011643 [Diaporthe australafricana]|uniref:Uncharacterized protein n=1 Tax=Diaporthe australafricana TaxID=127596 RepID=A0ABR3W5L4_9PEZI
MAITAFVNMLLGIGFANAVNPAFQDGNTLLAPNAQGKMIAHHIVNMTTEIAIPGTSDKVNVTGTVEQVIAYINATFPDYVWPGVEELNTTASQATAEDNQVFCNVFEQTAYYEASLAIKYMHQLGSHLIKLGDGPSNCAQVACHQDLLARRATIWWCNDDDMSASSSYSYIADLAQKVLDKCVEFAVPYAYVRGQVFDTSIPWNVIVTYKDHC